MQKIKIDCNRNCDINQILECIRQTQGKDTILRQITNFTFTALIWNIWCERNSRIFRAIEMSESVRTTIILQEVKILMKYILKNQVMNSETKLIWDNLSFDAFFHNHQQPPWKLLGLSSNASALAVLILAYVLHRRSRILEFVAAIGYLLDPFLLQI